MNVSEQSRRVFIELVKAGLWEKEVRLTSFESIDFNEVYRLAQEQAVVGLVAAGLEKVVDVKVPQVLALTIAGEVLQLEQRNKAMNEFISQLITKLRSEDVNTLLVKGQGIAQCYEKPLWRSCGDVDLFLNHEDYKKTFGILQEKAILTSKNKAKNRERLNAEFQMDSWLVELHGTLHANLSSRMDKVIDSVQHEVFIEGKVRIWKNGGCEVIIPAPSEDLIFVFSHILQHFFLGGIGLRQLCDLSRLLWTYRDSIDKDLLYDRLQKMGVVSEWKVFVALMVKSLGLPLEAAPLYECGYEKKADKALNYILEVGNFGHNRDSSYLKEKSNIKRKSNILLHQLRDSMRLATIFPIDAWRFFFRAVSDGVKNALDNQ